MPSTTKKGMHVRWVFNGLCKFAFAFPAQSSLSGSWEFSNIFMVLFWEWFFMLGSKYTFQRKKWKWNLVMGKRKGLFGVGSPSAYKINGSIVKQDKTNAWGQAHASHWAFCEVSGTAWKSGSAQWPSWRDHRLKKWLLKIFLLLKLVLLWYKITNSKMCWFELSSLRKFENVYTSATIYPSKDEKHFQYSHFPCASLEPVAPLAPRPLWFFLPWFCWCARSGHSHASFSVVFFLSRQFHLRVEFLSHRKMSIQLLKKLSTVVDVCWPATRGVVSVVLHTSQHVGDMVSLIVPGAKWCGESFHVHWLAVGLSSMKCPSLLPF